MGRCRSKVRNLGNDWKRHEVTRVLQWKFDVVAIVDGPAIPEALLGLNLTR
jgi:hypothetical protein